MVNQKLKSLVRISAHKAIVHGQTSKQARTIDLQFNLAPRNRPIASRLDEAYDPNDMATRYESNATAAMSMSARRLIDARNEQEFPLLGNAPVSIRPSVTLNTRPFGTSGLARTKENFPALGGNDAAVPQQYAAANMPKASAILFRTPALAKPTTTANSAKAKQKVVVMKSANDFPALPGAISYASSRGSNNHRDLDSNLFASAPTFKSKPNIAKQKVVTAKPVSDFGASFGGNAAVSSRSSNSHRDLDSDLIEAPPPAFNLSVVSSKHRALVQSYESVSTSGQLNQTLKTVQRVETKSLASNNDAAPIINSKKNFPSLGASSVATANAAAPQWLNAAPPKYKKDPVQSKKSKVAPAPLLPTSKTVKSNGENNTNAASDATPKKNGKAKSTKDDGESETASKSNAKQQKPIAKATKKANGKDGSNTNKENNGDKTKTSNQKSKKANAINGNDNHAQLLNGYENAAAASASIHETINSYSSVATFTAPPPGFPAKSKANAIRAPPGFETAFGDSQSSTFAYISPSNALQRNQVQLSFAIYMTKCRFVAN